MYVDPDIAPRGVLPKMAYMGRLRLKGVPFSGFRYIKGLGNWSFRYSKEPLIEYFEYTPLMAVSVYLLSST